ncbi:MAG: histidine phosphatase family protein [Woeseiaceae bacterium]
MTLPKHEFVFLRHGQTEYNRERRFQGHRDVPLNDRGVAQAATAADLLAKRQISRIVASPARRVQQTIEPLLQASELPMHIEDDLMDFFGGSFEGRLITDIRREHGLDDEESLWSILPDDAERWSEFVYRAVSAVARWTEQHAGETVLIASHGLVFRSLAETLVGEKLYSGNAEAHHFRPVGDEWIISPV